MRLGKVGTWLQGFGGWSEVEKNLKGVDSKARVRPHLIVGESTSDYGDDSDEIPF
jgi:hypothetical protein